ncbi:NADPH-dependent butanol dehydrogenase [Propionispora sp. 2/2-37]|uniref:iron-containing alcohol dehydrogenase n=1 Tax=Propionispora sp. 2/2-37 TaxID=1677858 RepID=UPI0006BB8DFF|nr:iron-containing alcohol dehydrogenase [Propionispora sp. 2/2-37]CUH97028.1 NADPH-dependent butanol dehydrogenase [Propionispora sp. 2/2-37]
MKRFTIPRDIYFGRGCMEEVVGSLTGNRAMIVTGGSSMQKFGFLRRVEASLKQANMEVKIFEGVEPDPSVETVMRGAQVMREFKPDWIVSIGGGSPIDAAKAMWVFYEHPELSFEDIKDPFSIPTLRKKARFIAIPSTSGTATEVTAFSVITDYNTKIKYPLADYHITPDIAIVDPELADTMPPQLVAHTGMDAFTHALEAYVATARSPFTNPLALEALIMIKKYLIKSYHGDQAAREQIHIAQCLAGMAFSNALLGITHSMAHKIGALFHIPHGCANAILMPYVIAFNKKKALELYAQVAAALDLPGNSENEKVDSLIGYIRKLSQEQNIPLSLKEAGVTAELFEQSLDSIAANAVADPCTSANPRPVDAAAMKKLFTCAFQGTNVDF